MGRGGTGVAQAARRELYERDPCAGVKWTADVADDMGCTAALSLDQQSVYLGTQGSRVYSLNTVTGAKQWSAVTDEYVPSVPLPTSPSHGGMDGNLVYQWSIVLAQCALCLQCVVGGMTVCDGV